MADPKDPRNNPRLDEDSKDDDSEESTVEYVEEKVTQSKLLQITHKLFLLSLADDDIDSNKKTLLRSEVLAQIESDAMAPYYEYCIKLNLLPSNPVVLNKLKELNSAEFIKLDNAIEEAKVRAGDVEVREALYNKAKYMYNIGDKEEAIKQLEITNEKTVGSASKIDLQFALIRLALAFNDIPLLTKSVEKCRSLIENGGDWERKNLFSVYEAVYYIITRKFDLAAEKLINSIATFTNYELMDYNTFIFYTCIIALVKVDRVKLKEKIIKQPEILSNIDNIPNLRNLVFNLYKCDYSGFFEALTNITPQIRCDPYLHDHTSYYLREIRCVAYNQFLSSYRSATLSSMAEAFGVSPQFLDGELFRFISAGRIHAKIDAVEGVVETVREEKKNAQYQVLIKEGDQLLNRIQKLQKLISY